MPRIPANPQATRNAGSTVTEPILSVFLSNYNHERFIGEALEAILCQSRQPDEIIIIDDASTDNSIGVINTFRHRHGNLRVWHNERNAGVIYNMNRMLFEASGRYVFFAAADDKVLSGFFESALSFVHDYPSAGLVSGNSLLISEDGTDLGVFHPPIWAKRPVWLPPTEVRKKLEQHGSWFMGNATIYRRDSLIAAGAFRKELGAFCDGFVAMAVALRDGACFIPSQFAAWRRMESGYSSMENVEEERYFAVTAKAVELMSNEYGKFFSPRFIRRWQQSRIAGWQVQSATRRYNQDRNRRWSSQTARSTSYAVVDRLACSWAWLKLFVLKVYYALRYRRPLLYFLLRIFREIVAARRPAGRQTINTRSTSTNQRVA